jgi:hypothetical protein
MTMWEAIIFFLGVLCFLFFILLSKLYKFQGTKLKVRMNYALVLSLFFTLFNLWQSKGDIQIIVRGLMLGIILGIPFCVYSKRWIDKKMEGATIFYKSTSIYLNVFWALFGVVLVQVLMTRESWKKFVESVWPILGLCLSWFISQVFIFFYVVKLERKLGAPILEDNK